MGRLRALTALDASHNNLQCLPDGRLSSPPHTRTPSHPLPLPEIGECTQLVFLELQHNELTALPPSVGCCVSLRRLGLR